MSEKRVFNTFEFVGGLDIRKDTEKFKSYEKQEFESGWIRERLKVNVKTGDSSMLVEISDMYSKNGYKLKKRGKSTQNPDGSYTKGEEITIAWKDRNIQSVIDNVANWQKFILDFSNNKERYDLRKFIENLEENALTDEEKQPLVEQYGTDDIAKLKEKLTEMESMKHEFLSRVDLIKVLQEELPKHKDMKFKVTGNITFSQSPKDNSVYRTFEVDRIEKALDSDKPALKGDLDIFFNEDSLNEDDFEETKKYIIKAFVKTYDGQLKQDIYVPQVLILDTSRLDLNNPKHKARVNLLIGQFRDCEEDMIYELQYRVKFARGAERKEITLDELSDFTRANIEAGLADFEEIKRGMGGTTFGDTIDETRLVSINVIAYPDGRESTELKLSNMLVDKQTALEDSSSSDEGKDIVSDDRVDDDIDDDLF